MQQLEFCRIGCLVVFGPLNPYKACLSTDGAFAGNDARICSHGLVLSHRCNIALDQRSTVSSHGFSTGLSGQCLQNVGAKLRSDWSFHGGHRITVRSKVKRFIILRKSSGIRALWFANSQIAGSVFTIGTVAVLPFYTLMVAAPKAKFTKKCMESNIPYIVLGLLYAYLLYLSWTPETVHLMFASKYWLPELPGIAKMFTSEMTLASAWIHLLLVDLFTARQVYHDGLENGIETRHSVSLCLLFCPIGILSHVITKALTKGVGEVESTT